MGSRTVCILLNKKAGTATGTDADSMADVIAQPFHARGDDVTVRIFAPQVIAMEAQRIVKDPEFDVIVICGGDGTLSYFADAFHKLPVTLAFLPLGTMNLFARALNVPADPGEAAKQLAAGDCRAIDVGHVNGRAFLHHVSFGLHAKLVRQRQRMKHASRLGKIIAGVRAFFLAIRRPPYLRLSIRIDNADVASEQMTALVVSNNLFGDGHLPYPDDVNRGELGLYLISGRKWGELIKLGADVVMGRTKANPHVKEDKARRLEITSRSRRKQHFMRAVIDGEIATLRFPLTIETMPSALRVIVPSPHKVDRSTEAGLESSNAAA